MRPFAHRSSKQLVFFVTLRDSHAATGIGEEDAGAGRTVFPTTRFGGFPPPQRDHLSTHAVRALRQFAWTSLKNDSNRLSSLVQRSHRRYRPGVQSFEVLTVLFGAVTITSPFRSHEAGVAGSSTEQLLFGKPKLPFDHLRRVSPRCSTRADFDPLVSAGRYEAEVALKNAMNDGQGSSQPPDVQGGSRYHLSTRP